MKVSKICTPGFHGYGVRFSPSLPNLLACASSENYGIAGRGCLYLVDTSDANALSITKKFNYAHGMFDVTWSEANSDLIVTGCSNGSIQLWDHTKHMVAIAVYKIHEKEVYGVEWNPKNAYPLILSASWDMTVKTWDPFAGREVNSFLGHKDMVYAAIWSPYLPEIFASVSADMTMKVWDIRTPIRPCNMSPVHATEVLTCDWCKFNPNIMATGATDGIIRGWDMRNLQNCVFQLVGHEYAVRRLKFSPFQESALASVSYDFSTRFWDWNQPQAIETHFAHTEFVYGIDFNPQLPGQACDCAWDSVIHLYNEALM